MASDRFRGGAPMWLEGWMGLIKPDDLRIRIRAVLMILIGWVPLVLLAALQDSLYGGNSLHTFLSDFGSLARYVIAAPLFVVAESLCFPRFERIILHFRNSGLITGSDHDRYEKIVHSSSKLLRSKVAEILSYVIAYGLAAAGFAALPQGRLMSWSYYAGNGARVLSLAGKWHALVSVPLLFVLVLGWIWRQFAWARFLYLVSRMKLQLIPTHPDQCGGLIFLSTVIRAYRLIGFACASIVAGGILNRTIHSGAPFLAYRDIMLGMPLFITLVGIAPLFVFAPILKELHAKAMFEYGNLAGAIGTRLQEKWLHYCEDIPADALEVQDFSATTDLYSVAANVYRIAYLPLNFRAIRELLIFTALPFIPVLFIAVPLKAVFDTILKLAIS